MITSTENRRAVKRAQRESRLSRALDDLRKAVLDYENTVNPSESFQAWKRVSAAVDRVNRNLTIPLDYAIEATPRLSR